MNTLFQEENWNLNIPAKKLEAKRIVPIIPDYNNCLWHEGRSKRPQYVFAFGISELTMVLAPSLNCA